MPISTSLQCPHCGFGAQTTKAILPGAKVRCTRCKSVFRITPNDGGPTRPASEANGLAAKRLHVLFDADNDANANAHRREVDIRVVNDSREELPPRSAGKPLTVTKKPTLDGKPLPFHGPRNMVGFALLAVGGLLGYGFIRWYTDTVVLLDATAVNAVARRQARVKSLVDSHVTSNLKTSNAPANNPAVASPGASTPVSTRTVAPQTERIGHLVVGVFEARLSIDDGAVGKGHLTVTVRVTNRSAVATTFVSWSDPTRKVILSDQYDNYYNRIGSDAQGERVIQPDQTIVDTLEFEKPLPGAVLALDLPSGDQNFQFSMPTAFVQRTQVAMGFANIPTPPRAPAPAQAPVPAPVLAPPQAAASAPEQPYSPERDPQIIADVNAAYDVAMKRVEKRVLGMTSNNASRFRKTEKDRIIKVLADKMDMTVDQITHMLSLS